MRKYIALAALLGLCAATVSAQEALKIHYEASGGAGAGESGSHTFGPGGFYRWDKTSGDESTSLIVLNGERIEVNHRLGIAVRGPVDDDFAVPVLNDRLEFGRQMEFHPDSPEYKMLGSMIENGETHEVEELGSRAHERLLLTGYRSTIQTLAGPSTKEWWEFTAPSGRTIEIEYSYSDGGSQRITGIERGAIGDAFSIPSRMTVYDRWQR